MSKLNAKQQDSAEWVRGSSRRTKEGADCVVAEIASKGGKAIAVKADVARTAEVKRHFREH
jgi:hypothetical protein